MKRAVHATLDHLVVAADTLEQGEDHLEALFGARPQRGGKHVTMGTHNSLLRIGAGQYIEVIAIDPEGIKPARPRWFDLDRPPMRALLQQQPRLVHWLVRVDDIDAARAACPVDPGVPTSMQRGTYSWRLTIPGDGQRPGAGVVPGLIQWADARHPADALPDAGIRIAAIAAAHPEPDAMRSAVASLGLEEVIKITYDAAPRLAAMLRSPRGTVTL